MESRHIAHPQVGALDAMQKPQVVYAIAACLVSPIIPSRAIAAEMLVFFTHWDLDSLERLGQRHVLRGFDVVEAQINAGLDAGNKVGRFDTWMRQLEAIIDGRGRMGSAVGLGKDLKGLDDSGILDYCVGHHDTSTVPC